MSLVEPGAVATAFGDTAVATINAGDLRAGSDYAAFRELLASKIHDAYEGAGAKRASSPERIAAVID